MRYLLDTNIFLFSVMDKDKLCPNVLEFIRDYNNRVYISAISVYEAINLQQSGAFSVHKKQPLANGVVKFIKDETNVEIKPINEEHLNTLDGLPKLAEHKDPVDRMIIAHAITEGITLISSDTKFPRYTRYGLDLIFNDY